MFVKSARGSNITLINHPVQSLSARLDSAQPNFQVSRHVRDAAQFPQSGFRAVRSPRCRGPDPARALCRAQRETFDAAIGTARNIAEKFFAPHNRKGDENEPRYEDGQAILIPEVKPAVDAFLEAGFLNAARSFEAGGMQLPTLLSQACFAHFQSANAASTSYPFLTMGAANLIESFGSEEQKQRFLQPMIDGRFFGTMALTEPHAGSSLSDIRTRAEPASDGTYRLKGDKNFHFRWRSPAVGKHRAHGARQTAGRPAGGERYFAVYRAEVSGQRRRQPRPAQRRAARRL